MEKIAVKNLTFTYPQREIPSLKNINFTVNPGEFITICGKSGCGKSTLLRQLKPVIAPHGNKEGVIYFDGRDITELTQREESEKIGFVQQNPDNQIVCDKVWHELAFGLESLGFRNEEIRARVAEMASFFGIYNWFYKDVSELSGGQKQLLNLASVMVMQPSVMILDEPTSQLDPIAAHDFLDTLSKINKELGTAIILTEHRLEEAFPISDRIVVMENGEIIADGTPREIAKCLNDTNNDMFSALPTPMRVYYSKDNNYECPVTVRDARTWLVNMPVKESVPYPEEIKKPDNNFVIELDEIWFRYEKNAPDVLKNMSLKISENEIYAIVGGNGAGKTTTLSVILGINKPYRGKVKIMENKTMAALTQNPQSLFVKKTVLEDLHEMLSDIKMSTEEKEEKIRNVIDFCELQNLLMSHPFDLSGGEQQRAALAKVLLKEPDILILDEPTKGLDAHFKEKFADLLKKLKKSGVTIIMVSHDVEFCAKYADRLGMFFDGKIVSEDTPRRFFSGKSFYTTAANRMSRNIIDNAVLDEDIISAIGGRIQKRHEESSSPLYMKKKIYTQQNKKSEGKIKNIIFGSVFLILFAVVQFLIFGEEKENRKYAAQLASIFLLGGALWNFIPKRTFDMGQIQTQQNKRKLSKRTVAAALVTLILVPVTVFVGVYYLGDRKYYFISLLIILETMFPFIFIFEKRRPQARELVIISVLCAISVAGRAAFAAVPQFKPVVAMTILSGICFGGETGFLVGAVTGFVSNFFFGQGPWTPWQMFAFGIIGFLAGILFRKGLLRKNKTELCIFGFLTALVLYGGIMNLASVLMYQANPNTGAITASYALGLPFDLIHAFSTSFFLWFAAEPMCEKIERVKVKYGLLE